MFRGGKRSTKVPGVSLCPEIFRRPHPASSEQATTSNQVQCDFQNAVLGFVKAGYVLFERVASVANTSVQNLSKENGCIGVSCKERHEEEGDTNFCCVCAIQLFQAAIPFRPSAILDNHFGPLWARTDLPISENGPSHNIQRLQFESPPQFTTPGGRFRTRKKRRCARNIATQFQSSLGSCAVRAVPLLGRL
jgi:hypothetical protein